MLGFLKICGLFRISSVVEQRTVNPFVAGSKPASGVLAPKKRFLGAFFCLNALLPLDSYSWVFNSYRQVKDSILTHKSKIEYTAPFKKEQYHERTMDLS
jgi:hypothetical protein